VNKSDYQAEHEEPWRLNHPLSLVTLSELKSLGQFARYQDIGRLLASASPSTSLGYPLFATRLNPNKYIDLLLKDKWEVVEFLAVDNSHIYYRKDAREEKIPLDDPWARGRQVAQYCVAPAGLYTAYSGDTSTLDSATLSKAYELSSGSFVTGCEVQRVSSPYVTLRIEYADGRGGSGWDFETFHIADPRIHVDGVVPYKPFYNSPIAVSHRWLSETHPDPNRIHVQELFRLCEEMKILDCQTFFIDYCSLPQLPRSLEEEAIFHDQLPKTNRYYQKSTIILTNEVDDYETRAWCNFLPSAM
jgi:hypothetical protein